MQILESPQFTQTQQQEKQPTPKGKQSAKSKLPKIVINIAETQYAVVKQVSKKNKWILLNEAVLNMNFDLCWTDMHVKQEIFYKMNQSQKINHFPGMDILSRKNNLGKNLMSFRNKFPEQYEFFPITWTLPNDFAQLKKSGKAQTFIVKPQASCQGRGIFMTRQIDKLKGERCVVQRYLHKPFLIDGLKFDLRIYVLLAGTDPFRIFVYEEGLGRFATQPYCPPRTENLDNKFMHLTNYAINKNSPDFVFNQSLTQCNKGHKRSLTSVYKTMQEMGCNIQETKTKIDDIIIKTLITGYPTLSRLQQSIHPENYANDMCFEILGLDVMFDYRLNPYLLQINYTPSFTTDTPLDKHIKKNLISDAVRLLGISQEWKAQMKKKRDLQIKQRMLSGKRKKLSLEQKIQLIQQLAKERDEFQKQNIGGFRKIFVKSEDQFHEYRQFYEYAEQLYIDQNKLTGVSINNYCHFIIPFLKDTRDSKKKKLKRQSSLHPVNDDKKNQKTFYGRSSQNRNIKSAKSVSKRVIVSSSNNLQADKQNEVFQDNNYFDYFEAAEFKNKNIKNMLKKVHTKYKKQKDSQKE